MLKKISVFVFPAGERRREGVSAFLIALGLLLFLSFTGLSKSLATVGACIVCAGLVLQLVLQGPKSFLILSSKPLSILLLLVFAWLAFRSFDSIDLKNATTTFRTAIYKGLVIFIGGMELLKRPRYFRILVLAIALSAFVQGVNGIWQYCTGYDFIKGDPLLGGRLTSAFSTYRVGDLMAMFLVLLICLPWALPKKWPVPMKSATVLCLLLPAVFLWIFADSRSGFIFTFVSIVALLLVRHGIRLKIILPALGFAALVVLLGVSRFDPEVIMRDGRIQEVWPFAWEVFKANPIIGVGSSGYTAGFTELGLVPKMHPSDLAHPHNIYLQFLAEFGIIGFVLWVTFFMSIIYGAWKVLRRQIVEGVQSPSLLFVTLCWAGCCGYMLMAGSAHAFLRDWWFGVTMFYFGVTAGAIALNKAEGSLKSILESQ